MTKTSHPRNTSNETLRIFVPIAPDDPWYKKFEEQWRKASEDGTSGCAWNDSPAIRELECDLVLARKKMDESIREIVDLRLSDMGVDRMISAVLDKRIESAVAAAAARAGQGAETTAREMLNRKVSAEIANNYDVHVDVTIRRKDHG